MHSQDFYVSTGALNTILFQIGSQWKWVNCECTDKQFW